MTRPTPEELRDEHILSWREYVDQIAQMQKNPKRFTNEAVGSRRSRLPAKANLGKIVNALASMPELHERACQWVEANGGWYGET